MTKEYKTDAQDVNELMDEVIFYIEKETEKKVFTLGVTGANDEDLSLDVIIVFKDKEILVGQLLMLEKEGTVEIQIQGNFV